MTSSPELRVLFKNIHWIAVEKPSGIPTTAPDGAKIVSLVDLVVSQHPPAHGTTCHPLSRLDVEVTGVVLFARSAHALAAAEMNRAEGGYHREYVALVSPAPHTASGVWTSSIGVDPTNRKLRTHKGGLEAQQSTTHFTTLGGASSQLAALLLRLQTGRTHQIRVHTSGAGCPVLGDRSYHGAMRIVIADGTVVAARRVMLHAWRVGIPRTQNFVICEIAPDMQRVWSAVQQGQAFPELPLRERTAKE